jgi:hypothetical protein
LDALVDRLDRTSFRVNETPQGPEEVEEVELEETSEEEELGEEDQVDATNVMRKVTWLGIFLIRGNHGALTAEPMGMQLKTSQS